MDRVRRRSLLVLLATLCLGAAITIAIVASRDGANLPEVARSKPLHQPPERPPGEEPCHKGSQSQGHTIPAQLVGNNASSISTEILIPVNGWEVGDCHGATFVYAGAAGWRDQTGIFVITRVGRNSSWRKERYVVVPDIGATKITEAPTGQSVITSAQRHGQLKFTSRQGTKGTLTLKDDTATLSTGEVIKARDRPFSGNG